MQPRYRHPRLFAPGPTQVPEAVRLAMAAPQLHHRSPAFAAALDRVRQGLRWAFGTEQQVLLLSGSGTLAMEAAVTNLLSPGDTALYVDAGRFGRRWGDILAAYGVHGVAIDVPWGQAVRPEQVAEALAAHPQVKAVYLQACETSTGVRHPVEAIAQLIAQQPQVISVIDAITAAGIEEVAMDACGYDVVLGASQKGFMMPPGLCFMALSDKAWAQAGRATLPRFYVDLARERTAAANNQTSWTTPTSLVLGLAAALELMQDEGLAAYAARHRLLADACRAGATALGCALYASQPAPALTACLPPEGLSGRAVVSHLAAEHGITIGGGMEHMQGKLLRLGHMGHVDGQDLVGLMAALGATLVSLGHPVPADAGACATLMALENNRPGSHDIVV